MTEMTKDQRDEIRKRFSSGNNVPVERAHLYRDEGLALLADAERLAEVEAALREEIKDFNEYLEDTIERDIEAEIQVWRLQRILDGGERNE